MGATDLVLSMALAPRATLKRVRTKAMTRIVTAIEKRVTPQAPVKKPPAETLVRRGQSDVWTPSPASLPGLNLHAAKQLELVSRMTQFERQLPLLDSPEAYTSHLIARLVGPAQAVDLGGLTPRALPPEVDVRGRDALDTLRAGDLLFCEGQSPTALVFDLLPVIPAGVWVRVGGTRYPFDGNRSVLRAFLSYNGAFQIRCWPSYLCQHHRDHLPRAIKNDSSSLWIRKVG